MALAEQARRRGVTRLVHFTPARNLPHIIQVGEVRPVAVLAADPEATYAVTDPARLDGHPEMTSCSFEYPNAYYLRVARRRARLYPTWLAFLLDVDVLDLPGVLLSTRNAASGTARPATPALLERLFADRVPGGARGALTRQASHLDCCPTDLQAEVLLPGPIPLSQVHGILVPTEEEGRELQALLKQVGTGLPSHWTRAASPVCFDPLALRDAVWAGERPEEVAW